MEYFVFTRTPGSEISKLGGITTIFGSLGSENLQWVRDRLQRMDGQTRRNPVTNSAMTKLTWSSLFVRSVKRRGSQRSPRNRSNLEIPNSFLRRHLYHRLRFCPVAAVAQSEDLCPAIYQQSEQRQPPRASSDMSRPGHVVKRPIPFVTSFPL